MAQDPTPPPTSTVAPASSFDVEAATDAYLARQSSEERSRSDAYFEGGYWLQLWGFLYTLGVCWLILGTGLSARMKRFAERVSGRRPIQIAIYSAQYVILTPILFFPLTVYEGFIREHQYGLATQTFRAWMGDFLTEQGVELVLMPLLLVALYTAFRRSSQRWWIWGSVIGVAFIALIMLIGPVYVDPLFNTYKPLEDPALKEPILSMARANGIDVDNVYVFDASRQTTRVSANVSGILGSMRIRLNDNLLERCSLPEIKAVMAHEMGHYVLGHAYGRVVFFGLTLVGGFLFLRWAFDRMRGRWGITGIDDIAGMPLLVALFAVYFFVLTPVVNTYIRTREAQADLFALHDSREPDGAAEVALKLGDYRKLNPGPIEEWIFFDHPSGRSRIHMAMTWKAEHLDEVGHEAKPAEPGQP